MRDSRSVAQLLQKIETSRHTLNQLANSNDLLSPSIVIQSQKLDQLLNEYELAINHD